MDFRDLIEREAAVLRSLHGDIHYHFDRAGKTARGRADVGTRHGKLWREACARFHAYASPLDEWVKAATGPGLDRDAGVREFALTFLELDPMYFCSGYAKEEILRRLKQIALDGVDRARLEAILKDAVLHRGTREYRRYCRLAAWIGTPGLREQVEVLAGAQDGRIASRARMMLEYLPEEPGP